MVELQPCSASLVNASSALSAIEKQEVKGESNVNHVIAEISAELQRERQKNAELLEKISLLEAQIQQRDNQSLPNHQQGQVDTRLKKFKRQKTEVLTETENAIKIETDSEKKNVTKCFALVNWMSMDETQISQREKAKDDESTADCDHNSEDSDDEDDNYHHEEEFAINNVSDHKCSVFEPNHDTKEELICDRREVENIRNYKAVTENVLSFGTNCHTRSLNTLNTKKPQKVAFCPREVKRIIESEAIRQGNAQSHTVRKIIVFASLGIRHGCEDMYELDFNHFSILRKGEPYESPTNPGEHVLYENPRYRRKVFYPNKENPTLCPVRILEEEKAMRPSDSSCPSCLFLCIKYGGRTRNLPQNEYVRQRMGKNKLKSFGPLMCRMAMLVHIRSGSFFFKALGITLLFMAGFPDDLVQKETKYRNFDLLQKYYRTDEEAQGEDLFLQHPIMTYDAASPSSQHLTGKTPRTKSKAKNQTNSNTKPQQTTQTKPSIIIQQPSNVHLNSGPPTQFGLMGFASVHTHAMGAFQPIPSQPQTPLDNTLSMSLNSAIANSGPNLNNVSYHNQFTTPYHHMFPHQPANGFVPQALMYWPHPNTYPQPHYALPYHGYRSFPSPGNYISIHPQPYNYASHASGSHPISPKHEEGDGKRGVAVKEADSDHSDSSSSSTEPAED